MILNINDQDIQHIICSKNLTLKKDNKSGECSTNDQSLQECVEENDQIVKSTDPLGSCYIL